MNTPQDPAGSRLAPTPGSALFPCPFCGGRNVLISRPHQSPPDHFVAICTPEEHAQGCGASGTWKGTEKEAAEAWNQRIVHALYPDDIRELTERLKDDHPETSGKIEENIVRHAKAIMRENHDVQNVADQATARGGR